MKPFDIIVSDIEGDGLYHEVTRIWCAVVICCLTGQVRRFGPDQIGEYLEFISGKFFVGHNILDYDQPVLEKLYGYQWEVESSCDTLVLSRLINPERRGGHSLGSWGEALGEPKIDYRAKAEELGIVLPGSPKGAEFKIYHPWMLTYNEGDCKTNLKLLNKLLEYLGWSLEELRDNLRGFRIG